MNCKLNLLASLALALFITNGVQGLANLFPDDTNCNDGFIANKGSKTCYKVYPDAGLDYWEASEYCQKLGGSLLSVYNLDDFLIRIRVANTFFPDRRLRIEGYQVSENVFKDNDGNIIKLPTLIRVAKHSGSLTIHAQYGKDIRVFGQDSIIKKLGLICERERQGKPKRIHPIGVKPVEVDSGHHGLIGGFLGLANLFPDDSNCRDGFMGNKGSKICYKVYEDAGLDYWEASEYCQKLGGSLLSVSNLNDFLIRIRAAKTFFPDRRLRIEGYQVAENEFKDNDGNIIKLPKLVRVAKHGGSLTIHAQSTKNIRVFGKDSILEKLGLICQRDRQGRFKKIEPLRVKPTKLVLGNSQKFDDFHGLAKLFPDDTNCKDGFIANKGSKICYKIFPDGGLNYWDASQFCDKLGGSLLSVDNLGDFFIRLRSAKTYYPDRHLRILGYQVSEKEFKDNHGNIIVLPKLDRRLAPHSGSLTIVAKKDKDILVVGNKSIIERLGFICQRDRQGEGKRIKPIKVRPHKPNQKRTPIKKFFECNKRVRVAKQGLNLLSHHGYTKKQDYPDNYFCSWILTAPKGKTLRLGFKSFEVEGSEQGDKCLFDYVQAYDGLNEHSKELYKSPLCGDRRPKSVVSSGRFVNLTFVSDHSVSFKGFVASVQIIDEHDEKQSCRGRCDRFYENYSCQCDEKCDEYDDCCYDYQRICH